MTFSWLSSRSSGAKSATTNLDAQLRELRDRAAMFYRLGFPAAKATTRLSGQVAWEHDGKPRPDGLSDSAIAELVRQTYARKPSR